jgi:Asp-tRNA(Asn)/Glu-tRNA(Gln) amidotransferase A subunit family amidase
MPPPGPDIFFATLTELNAKLKAREISVLELTRAFTARLERIGPRYNALALPLTEQAQRRARELDDDIKRDRWRSPIHGIPFAVKDLLSFAGQPTTWGARPYAGQVFDYSATAVTKLDKAGGVLIGKLAMVELAGGPAYRYASASLTGPGMNPWDRTRWSGGSSSGSGIAVAAGLAPFAIGSETSGSILTPSAYCGITGLRPTYGLVSRYGAMALCWTLDKLGPMCRSAVDCALVLETMAGGDANDPGSAGKSFYYLPQFAKPVNELRVGYAPVDFTEWADPAARAAFQQALAVLRDMGLHMMETKLPDLPYGPVLNTILSSEASEIFEPLIASGKVDELADQKQIAGLKAGLEIPAKDYLKAMRIRRLMKQEFAKMFLELDLLVAPSRPGPATKVTDPLDRRTIPTPAPKSTGMTALTPAGNLAGLPAIGLPCGFADKLPVAIQVVGPPYSENVLVAVGKAFQERTDWHRQHPAVG